MTREDLLNAYGEDLMFADGFDVAMLGVVCQATKPPVVCYSYNKCVKILMETQNCTRDEAVEWLEFNVVTAYVGETTPAFLDEGLDVN